MTGKFRPPASTAPQPRPAADVHALADMLGARVHVDVVVPRTNVAGKMRLCSRREEFEAKAAARTMMLEAGYPVDAGAHTALGATEQWVIEVATQMLAIAMRDPKAPSLALGSIDEWRECDDQQILALWAQYQDLTQRLDPLGTDALTDAQFDELVAVSKKKDADILMAFGSRVLALFAISSAARLASSETPTSSSGP